MAAKRAPTAFFIFSEEQREGTRAECVAQAEPGAKVSVAAVAKAIGEKWRALTDEEKASYKEKVAERVKAQASAAAEHAADTGEQGEGEEQMAAEEHEGDHQPDAQHNTNPFGFPLSLIKRIMCFDPEVARISGDGLKAMAKAAELMVELLGSKAAKEALSHKRKTIKFTDVERAVRTDRRLVEVGLKEVLAEDMFREAAGGKGPLKDAGNRGNAGKDEVREGETNKAEAKATGSRKKAKEDDSKVRQITDFFAR